MSEHSQEAEASDAGLPPADDAARARDITTSLWKPCDVCGQLVHARAKNCKACQAVSPWYEPPAAGPAQFPAVLPGPDDIIGAYVAVKDFVHRVDVVTISIKRDRVLTEPALIRSLLAARQPIVPVEHAKDIVCCPNCHIPFSLAYVRGEPT